MFSLYIFNFHCKNFEKLGTSAKFNWIFFQENLEVSKSIAIYINKYFELRKLYLRRLEYLPVSSRYNCYAFVF